jgi:uncharacterized protein
MELMVQTLEIPEGANVIFGQSHFIKTVEDLYEILIAAVPGIRFGVAFCEASGDCLIRSLGNDPDLERAAVNNAKNIGAGHSFNILIRQAFPINVLNAIKTCQEVCSIYCATANPTQVILAQTDQGRGVLGVVDGFSPKGIEGEEGRIWRRDLLRKFGYKL